jgi:hypothetical protein
MATASNIAGCRDGKAYLHMGMSNILHMLAAQYTSWRRMSC